MQLVPTGILDHVVPSAGHIYRFFVTAQFLAHDEGFDTIADFSQSHVDTIAVTGANVGGLPIGALSADWFAFGSSATSADHGRFLFDPKALTLSRDADGTATGVPVVEIAEVARALSLHASDNLIV